jgi:protein O-GlcNAc transferase
MPTFQEAVNNAKHLYETGRLAEAEQLYLHILGANPTWPDGHAAMSRIFFDTNRLDMAIVAMQTAIANRPVDLPGCFNNLGVLLHAARRFTEAADAYRKAIALIPNYAIAHRNLGDSLRSLEQWESAEQSYRQAIRIDPKMVDAHIGVGLTFYFRGKYLEAIDQYHFAMKLAPRDVNALMNLIPCYMRLGDQDAIEKTVRQAIALCPNEPQHHSGLLMFLNYVRGADLPVVLNESLEFNRRHVLPLAGTIKPHSNDRDPDRQLRIGYISPDFRNHPVAVFFEPLLMHHDRKRFHITCYAEVETPDVITESFQARSDLWRNTVGQSHEQVAERIRADGIDILIDLAGHSVDNRLPVLARKPAPIQITWLGYPNTTGMSTVNYRFTDRRADPEGAEKYYSEKLIRLPDAFFVYQPPAISPAVSPLPMLQAGHITFGSFNNIIKITPAMAHTWAEMLRAIPGARLLIAGIPAAAQRRLRRLIDGIDEHRIEMVDSKDFQDYLALHHRVDIALDPFPWAGHTTSCHSLWMGVPIISQAGPTAVSRAGASILGNLGMDADWIANSSEDYIRIAKDWSTNASELSKLRMNLRERLLISPLCDAEKFTRDFENQLRQLWLNATF